MKGRSQIYFYTIEMQSDRVARYNLSVSDRSRRVLISNPEPDQVVNSDSLVVKGQVFEELETVTIQLIDESGALLQEQVVPVTRANESVYTATMPLRGAEILQPGEYSVRAIEGDSQVEVSFIYTPENLQV
jgi:hypothetical protein